MRARRRFLMIGAAIVVALAGAPVASAAKPVASIADTEVIEPEALGDTTKARFTVSLSKPAKKTVRIGYDTGSGTALGDDYEPDTGKIKIKQGKSKGKIKILVKGDDQAEGNETFGLSLYEPKNATIDAEAGSATGTIIDSD